MKKTKFDVDIDVQSRFDKQKYGQPLGIYNEENGTFTPHPSGVVIDEDLPVDPETGLVPVDYKSLSDNGYVKIDLLSNHSYNRFKSKQRIYDLLDMEDEIPWTKLFDREFCDKLPHLKGNHRLVTELEPHSIEDLADLLALMRPGKIHLKQRYMRNKEATRKELYRKATSDKVYFKKSQAIAYATMITLVMLDEEFPSAFLFNRVSR